MWFDEFVDLVVDDFLLEGYNYGSFRIISFSLAAYNSDPRNYPDSSDFLEVFEDLPGRERAPGRSP